MFYYIIIMFNTKIKDYFLRIYDSKKFLFEIQAFLIKDWI